MNRFLSQIIMMFPPLRKVFEKDLVELIQKIDPGLPRFLTSLVPSSPM